MAATSTDVARLAGVSRATVSQVLNGYSERFASATTQKVLDAARELGYQPSAAGRALRRGSSDFVIALIPNTTFGSNLQDLFEKLTEDLADHGFTLVLRMSSRTPGALTRLVTGMKPAAVFSLAPLSADEREVLDANGVLAIDPPSVSQVNHNRAIGELQARTLLSGGHKHIAFVHLRDARQDPFGFAREEGVRAFAQERGVDILTVATDIDPDSALSALDALPHPVALACYNDDVAMAMMAACRIRGLNIPSDVALIGMDHTPLSRIALPRLTTIEYDLAAAAQFGAAGLIGSLGAGVPTPHVAPAALTLVEGATV